MKIIVYFSNTFEIKNTIICKYKLFVPEGIEVTLVQNNS